MKKWFLLLGLGAYSISLEYKLMCKFVKKNS